MVPLASRNQRMQPALTSYSRSKVRTQMALCLCIIGMASIAQAQQGGAWAVAEVAGARLEIRQDGGLALVQGKRTLISNSRLVIAAPGWRGSVSQNRCEPAEGYPKKDGNVYIFKGELTEPSSRVVWRFEQRVEPAGHRVSVGYAVTPTADVDVGEICVFIDAPIAEWAGKPVLLWPNVNGTLPTKQPSSRHFLSGPAAKAILGSPDPGQLTIGLSPATLCTVQDGREFGNPSYQFYPRLFTGGKVEAGRECRLELELIPNDKTSHAVRGVQLESSGPASIGPVTANHETVPQFSKLELSFAANGAWDNPFDPSQVAIDALIRGPGEREWTAPAFYYCDFERLPLGRAELLMPKGEPQWKVRFAPPVAGEYRYALRMVNRGQTVEAPEGTFRCTPDAARHGYLRVSRENPHYFQFDDGTPFFAVGMNVATLGGGGTAAAEGWYTKLAEVGGNFVRSWWCANGTDVESGATNRPDQGLGKYKLDDAWRIDYLLDLAERKGIHIMCCLETQQFLRRDKWWPRYTYNAANGGPVATPADFFANDEADEFFRRRLRYIVARWSYSTSVYAWQFWNEVSACNNFHLGNAAKWHSRMARYLRSVDPVRHIIHTNHGNMDGYEEIDGQPGMEVVSTNIYSRRDMAQTGLWAGRWMSGRYAKPFLLTEYGVGHRGGWGPEDPKGIIVHNGLWGPIMGGSAGSGLPWGWGHWIDAKDMYHYWQPVADVVRGIPFHKRQWRPVEVESFAFRRPGRPPYYADVFVEGWPRNYAYSDCPKPLPSVFHVDADGEVAEQKCMSATLGGKGSQSLHVTFPIDGALVVHVPEIHDRGEPVLEVSIDGRRAMRQPLPHDTQAAWAYWKSFRLPVPAGEHTIAVSNAGTGTIWTGYELCKYRRREGPDLDVAGICTDDYILLWLRNPEFIWVYAREGRQPKERDEGLLTLKGVADGDYSVVWRETTTSDILATAQARARGGTITLPTPNVARSAVAKIAKQE